MQTNGDDLPVLISPDEVSDCFNIQPETLTLWRKNGEGPPFYKINGTVTRYLKHEVIEYLQKCRQPGK